MAAAFAIDVHSFDGALKDHSIRTRFTVTEKQKLFADLLSELSKTTNVDPIGRVGLQLVISDTSTAANYDPTNAVYADDVLAEICTILNRQWDNEVKSSTLSMVSQQMADMLLLGRCSQGRCTRLLQIYRYLNEINDDHFTGPVAVLWNFVSDTSEIKIDIVVF